MNGSEPQIEVFKPFGEAFELMKKILFQPFDLKKWFVIGFAAWLSNLGGSGNYNYNYRDTDWKDMPFVQVFRDTISQIPHSLLVFCVAAFIVTILALIIVFA